MEYFDAMQLISKDFLTSYYLVTAKVFIVRISEDKF